MQKVFRLMRKFMLLTAFLAVWQAWCKILCKRNSTKSRRGAMESAQAAG